MKLRFTGRDKESLFCYIILAFGLVICVLPFLYCLGSTFATERELLRDGYKIIPSTFSLDTYKYIWMSKGDILLSAFRNTFVVCAGGVALQVFTTTTFAWAVTQTKEEWFLARPLSFFAWFTSVFGGGVFAWYVMVTQYYGLKNNLWALIIPSAFSVWNMFIIRGNFRAIPRDLLDAARIDGASAPTVFTRIVLPLGKAGIATVALYAMLGFWNDIYLPKWLITDTKLLTLQSFLERLNSNTQFISQNLQNRIFADFDVPMEGIKVVITTLTILPLMILYPFTLRYFVKGINLGGIKG